jgi:serine/threonine protein kinase
MTSVSTTSLVDALHQYRLLEPGRLEELKSLQVRFSDPKALVGELIRRGWVTPYQANQLLQGKGKELLLGSHVLLEKLGEGGMGQVFKARNWKLGRVVALKVIRKERMDSPDAVRRFQREVRAAAALSHPNIVHAFDADEIGGIHLLVMEYVEGANDLTRLVKKDGPLPVERACEFIRQAALGLQHASERGLVHRDIKPHNILLSADGKVVKILDMGLARLDRLATDDDKSSTMTQEGAIMGTPDYIAPEQAMASHSVDIRADLYSLGCTFYYLLTGKVPFPGGTLLEKVLKHQLNEPKSVEQVRPDVPPRVGAVVRKLMAKKPEDRFQTPVEVAAALGLVISNVGTASPASPAQRAVAQEHRTNVSPASGDTLDSPFAGLGTDDTEAPEDRATNQAKKADVPSPGIRTDRAKISFRHLGAGIIGLIVVSFVALIISLLLRNDDKKASVRSATGQTDGPDRADWVELFNGHDMSGWRTPQPNQLSSWMVEDGSLTCKGTTAHLFTRRGDYKDFRLRVEAKVGKNCTGGQGIRALLTSGSASRADGYLLEQPTRPAQWGGLFLVSDEGTRQTVCEVLDESPIQQDTWYVQEVMADGKHVVVWINERKVIDYVHDGNGRLEGHIVLYAGSGPDPKVQYRKVEVKELPR